MTNANNTGRVGRGIGPRSGLTQRISPKKNNEFFSFLRRTVGRFRPQEHFVPFSDVAINKIIELIGNTRVTQFETNYFRTEINSSAFNMGFDHVQVAVKLDNGGRLYIISAKISTENPFEAWIPPYLDLRPVLVNIYCFPSSTPNISTKAFEIDNEGKIKTAVTDPVTYDELKTFAAEIEGLSQVDG